MLLVGRASRVAVHVPVLLLAFTGAMFATSIAGLIGRPSVGPAIGALVIGALFAFMVGQIRIVTVRDSRLRVSSVFGGHELELDQCAFGVSVAHGSRGGATYTVYVSDGADRAEISDHWRERWADGAADDLEVLLSGSVGANAVAVERIARDRENWKHAEANAKAQVDAYYRSPASRTARWIVLGVLITAVVTAVVVQLVLMR